MNCGFSWGGDALRKTIALYTFYDIISRESEKDDYTMELDSNNHSAFLLYYHLVLVVKYRRKVFSEKMSQKAG